MTNPSPCPRCGSTSSSPRTDGLCPRCLVAVNFDSNTFENTQPQNAPTLRDIDELAAKLPDFDLIECLGRGGMGIVYKARQKSLDRLIAIKILVAENLGTERFEQEARTLAKLNHPNIVTVHDSGTSEDIFYIIMEYVDGVTLRDVIRDGQLSTEEAVKIVPAICEALEYAHEQGIVHRDIKPENILLDRSGAVKLVDFGIAKMLDAESTERAGTPAYMAPEEQTDHRSDIYALGVVLYELLTGEQPPRDLAERSKLQIDVRIDEVVLRALNSNPEQRYQSATEFRTQVQTINDLPTPVPAGEWQLCCEGCGNTRSIEDSSGIRIGAVSAGKKVKGYCRTCTSVRTLVVEKSGGKIHHVKEIWRWEGFDYRSKKTLFGYPLLNITAGIDPATGKQRTAKGIIAVGDKAIGIISFGTIAFGVFSFGAVGIGIFGMGGLAIGLVAYGGGAIGLIFSFGGFAIAPIAFGGYAIGYYAFGGQAIGIETMDGNHATQAAKAFFSRISQYSYTIGIRLGTPTIFAVLLIQFSLISYGRRKANNKPYTRHKAIILTWLILFSTILIWSLFKS